MKMAFGKIGEVILKVLGELCSKTFIVELGAVTSPKIDLEVWPVPGWAGHVLLWW